MKYIEGQILSVFCQVMYRHAEIVSGAYKFSKMQQACGNNEDGTFKWRDLTEDEKLKDSLNIMQRQIHRLNDTLDYMGSMEDE